MDNNKKLVEGLLKADGISPAGATESERIAFGKMLDQQSKSKQSKPGIARPDIWRIIMQSKITKFAAAAVFVAVALLSVTLLDKTVTPAWAIEDTIKALEKVYAIKMSGPAPSFNLGEFGGKCEGDFVIWAKPDENGPRSKELRFEISNRVIVVDASETTYFYNPEQNHVTVKNFNNFHMNPWLDSEFFHTVKRFAENWKVSYGKDEETNRDSIFATCMYTPESRSWWFQFDAETRLPVRFKQWRNVSFEGEPEFYAENIEYNPPLPDEIFEFEIPEGVEVVKLQQKLPEYLDDPNYGIIAEGLSDGEACLMIVEDYLQALIDGAWEYLAQLRPICNAENWELKYKRNDNWPVEIIQIGQPVQEDGCKIGPIVASVIKYSDGQIKNIKLIVKIRNIDGNKSYVIAGTYGGTKDFER